MKIYKIVIAFPSSSKDSEIQSPIWFDKQKAIQEARELLEQCDPEEEKVIIYEEESNYEAGNFRTIRQVKF